MLLVSILFTYCGHRFIEKHFGEFQLLLLCSARDEKEIGLCMKDINSPAYHPTMISLWVTDSFERKDKERELLAKLLVNLVKSSDNALTEVQLVKG